MLGGGGRGLLQAHVPCITEAPPPLSPSLPQVATKNLDTATLQLLLKEEAQVDAAGEWEALGV